MSPVIVVEQLVKYFGRRPALHGVSFTIADGEVIGLLGPNGSGKSTLLRILTGYLAPSAGRALVAGLDAQEELIALRRMIGYVPEDAPLYDGMRVGEFLTFMARIKGLTGPAVSAATAAAREQLRLDRVFDMPVGKLSRGYRQRVAIAQALLNAPRLLILDEPTNGLDAYQVIAVRDVIRALAGRCTIIVASHVLSEIERLASRVMILLDGALLTGDALNEAQPEQRYRLRIAGAEEVALASLSSVPGVVSATRAPPDGREPPAYVVAAGPSAGAALAAAAAGAGLGLAELVPLETDLETIFLELTRRKAGALAA